MPDGYLQLKTITLQPSTIDYRMFSFDEYAKSHQSQIVIGRKTSGQIIEHVLDTLPATLVPITSIDSMIIDSFVRTLSYNPVVMQTGIKADMTTCQLVQIYPTNQYQDYLDRAYKWIYLLIEEQTAEVDSNCAKLALDLCVYRGISQQAFDEKGIEYDIYMNALKLLNEINGSDNK